VSPLFLHVSLPTDSNRVLSLFFSRHSITQPDVSSESFFHLCSNPSTRRTDRFFLPSFLPRSLLNLVQRGHNTATTTDYVVRQQYLDITLIPNYDTATQTFAQGKTSVSLAYVKSLLYSDAAGELLLLLRSISENIESETKYVSRFPPSFHLQACPSRDSTRWEFDPPPPTLQLFLSPRALTIIFLSMRRVSSSTLME